MKIGIRSRLYGGFAALVVLAGTMGAFSYHELNDLEETFDTRGRIEQAARELYTVNGLTDRFTGQSVRYRMTPTLEHAEGMKASLVSIQQLAEGLAQRALSSERRKAYESLRDQTITLVGETSKLVALGTQVRENTAGVFTTGDEVTRATSALVAQIRAGHDAGAVTATQGAEVERAILLVRVVNWRFLATKDPK
ncbi:MAG TPA: chemotaxis protein, partial [Methylobacterium sp.]